MPTILFTSFRLAAIKQVIGTYAEAVTAYEEVLDKKADYVPALKGIGETYLLMAKVAMKEFFHGRALQHLQKAADYLTK